MDSSKDVSPGNTVIESYIEGANGRVLVESRWKILENGKPYLATAILKPVK